MPLMNHKNPPNLQYGPNHSSSTSVQSYRYSPWGFNPIQKAKSVWNYIFHNQQATNNETSTNTSNSTDPHSEDACRTGSHCYEREHTPKHDKGYLVVIAICCGAVALIIYLRYKKKHKYEPSESEMEGGADDRYQNFINSELKSVKYI